MSKRADNENLKPATRNTSLSRKYPQWLSAFTPLEIGNALDDYYRYVY